MSKIKFLLGTTVLASGLAFSVPGVAQTAPAKPADAVPDDIIVTGVFNAKRIEDAPIAITAVTAEEIAQQVPVSAADLLKNVPGVFVNSSLGEIRNVVFSRGVSANSLDGAGGYFYVSLQEDGLPVEPLTSSNFGPDYFARADIMLNRLEALRGGTSTVTGPNAPGGIFNYISRTGKSTPGYEVQAKVGLEGDGRSPYYRADAYAGGQIGDNLYYAIGGFYRNSSGARDPGYKLNKGGQVRANLLYEYDGGSFRVDGKYLDDHNGWFEFIPTTNFNNPQFAPGFNNYSSVLPPSGARHSYTEFDQSKGSYDPTKLIHSQTLSAGATWDHDFSDVVHVQNRFRVNENKTNWNTGAVIFAVPLTDFFTQILTGTFGIPGTITYRNMADNSIAAQVVSFSGFDHTVTVNNLPNQSVLAGGVLSQVAFHQKYKTKEFQDQLTFGFDLGDHKLALGGYFAHTKLKQNGLGGGVGLSTLSPQPKLLTASIAVAGGGPTLQITDPTGFASHANGFGTGDGYSGTQNQYSLYGGDTWDVNDKLSVDVGIRYESLKFNVTNITQGATAAYGANGGGADGNPLTLFDNQVNTVAGTTQTHRNFHFLNYTGAVNYKVSDGFQTYLRYTKGRKAPDFDIVRQIDEPNEIATLFPKAQTIEQIEIGLKYNRDGIRLGFYPFYSKLSNVADQQVAIDNTGVAYTPPPQFGQIKTIGIEFNGDFDVAEKFNIRTAITIQSPKASKFATWDFKTPVRTDDALVQTPKGDADNNPKFMSRTTATYNPVEAAQIFLTHNYLGKRAANRNNAWYMPGFHTFDLGASYQFGEHFKLQANVNNVFNQFGVMSWARSGGFLSSLDRQGLTKAAVTANPGQAFSVIPAQPRSFWLTGTVKF
jgi:iron complex outermembrane recepter protein